MLRCRFFGITFMLAKNIVNMQNYRMKDPTDRITRDGLVDVYPRFVGDPSLMNLIQGANEMIYMPRATSDEYEIARAAAIGSAKACIPEESLNIQSDVVGLFYQKDSATGASDPLGLTALHGARFLGIDSVVVELTDNTVGERGSKARKFTREVLGYCFRQTLPDGGNDLYYLPVDKNSILSFFMTEYVDKKDESDVIDLISKLIGDDRLEELIVSAENRLRYAYDDDFENTASDVIGEINSYIPREYYGMLINFSGRAYTYDRKTDEYLPTECAYSDAWLNGSEVIYIGGVERVVLELGVPSAGTRGSIDDEVRVYILPEEQYIKKFEAYYCSDESEYELMDILQAHANSARSIIISSDFARSNRDNQVATLQGIIDQADEKLDGIRQIIARTGRVICKASRSVCLLEGIRKGTTHRDLLDDQQAMDGDIVADKIRVDIPELDMGGYLPFRGLKDFRYSDGELVLYLEDSKTGLVHMVRLCDVESLTAI